MATVDVATKLCGGVGSDVRRLTAKYNWGGSRDVVFIAAVVEAIMVEVVW